MLVCVCPVLLIGQTFKYPVQPDNIRDRQGRVAYMTEHFWDEQSIGDTLNFQSPRLLLDYFYLLKLSEKNDAESYANSFISLACRKEQTFGQILYWIDNILYDSSSPQYDERTCMLLMEAVLTSDADSVMKLIPAERVRTMKQNAIGEPANNFSFIDKMGQEHSLYDTEAPLLLLVFNNPNCSLCHQAEEEIAGNTTIQDMTATGKLKILAITPDAEQDEWEKHPYPESWMTGFDKSKVIYEKRLYDIQRLPSIYLLDSHKRVLLKEADYDRLCNFIQGNIFLVEE